MTISSRDPVPGASATRDCDSRRRIARAIAYASKEQRGGRLDLLVDRAWAVSDGPRRVST
jgi:hypothetical protein